MKKAYYKEIFNTETGWDIELTASPGLLITINDDLDVRALTLETAGRTESYDTMDGDVIEKYEDAIKSFCQWEQMTEEEANAYIKALADEWHLEATELTHLI